MAKISAIKVGFKFGQREFEITKQMAQELGDQAVPLAQQRIHKIAENNYSHLLLQLRKKLQFSGMLEGAARNVAQGGPRTLTYQKLEGGNGRITTPYWPALGAKYAKKNPKNKRFWYKHGLLAQAMANYIANSRPGATVKELKANRSHHKGKVNTKFQIGFEKMHHILSSLRIRESFIEGVASPGTGLARLTGARHGTKNNPPKPTLERAVYPERQRPFMRLMAAAIGRDMRKNLRKI